MATETDLTILRDFPPNYELIRATFPLTGREVFAWGGIIYNPGGGNLTPELIEHEKVHFRQQRHAGGPEKWWALYLKSPKYRLTQELEAHREEYRTFCRLNKDRNRQVSYLNLIASRLASSMYGRLISVREARERIKQ